MHRAKRAGLEVHEDWDMQEELQAGKAWGTYTGTGKGESSPPPVAEIILYSISAWNSQSKKNCIL